MSIKAVSNVGTSAYQKDSTVSKAKPVSAERTVMSVQNTQTVQPIQSVKLEQYKNYKIDKQEGNIVDEQIEKSNEKIKKAISDLNKNMPDTSCQFGIHEGTGRLTIKIIDKETKSVIKEFPAEETLAMIEKVWELAGIMVDEKL